MMADLKSCMVKIVDKLSSLKIKGNEDDRIIQPNGRKRFKFER